MNTKFPYIVKRGHAYFFRQRVPTDLAHYFKSQSLVRSLKTRNEREAIVAAQSMAAKFEQVWAELRNPATVAEYAAEGIIQDIGAKPGDLADGAPYSVIDAVLPKYVGHLTKQYGKVPPVAEMRPVDREVRRQLFNVPPAEPTHLLSQALTLYLKYHTRGKEEKFIKERERPIQYCIDAIGDKPIDQISRQDARTVCEAMLKTGMKTRSARCYLSIIGATINKARTEWELSCANNFERLDIPGEKLDDKDVPPFTAEELKAIHAACLARDDDTAWVAGILLETGARINEVAGLRADDVHLTDGPIPFVTFKGNERRPVKTDGSERSIQPLTGIALWGATRALSQSGAHGGWLLRPKGWSPTGACQKVNGFIQRLLGGDKGSHSFRHSIIDRMLNADIPVTLAERFVGHSRKTVHEKYGAGYSLERFRDAIEKVRLPMPTGA